MASISLKWRISALRRVGPISGNVIQYGVNLAFCRAEASVIFDRETMGLVLDSGDQLKALGALVDGDLHVVVVQAARPVVIIFTIPQTGIDSFSSSSTSRAILTCPRPPSIMSKSGNFVKPPNSSSTPFLLMRRLRQVRGKKRRVSTSRMEA